MDEQRILTQVGFTKLKDELKKLETVEKPSAVERLKEAREMGLLDDNPEYDAARENLARLEGRILEIEEILKAASITKERRGEALEKIEVGSTAVVEIEGEKDTYMIVDSAEADPTQGRVSAESPVGKALLNTKVGDEVEVDLPQIKLKYKILEVHS